MLKGKPEDAPLVLGPESRIRPIDRPDAFPGDDVLTARALDQWTPPPEQQVRPMGFFGGKKPPAERTQDTIGREIKDVEKKLRRKDYTLNEAETLAEEGNLPPELRGLMIQHGDLVRESGRMQGAARTAKGGVETDSEYLRAESEMNKAADDVANAEYEIARELRDRGLNWEGDDAEFMGVVDQLRREGKLTNYLASRVEDLRAASTRMFNAEAKMKSRVKSFGLLTERGRDAVEQTFGAAYMSGTGSVAGGQYDLNGDGEIDNADLAIGSGIGLAAFASPLALRKVAELGGRLKGTRPQGFAASAGSGKRAAGYNNDLIEGSATFSDPRLNDKQNKILELYYNGASNEVIADEMDLSSYNAAAVTISKILKDFPDLPRNPAKKGKPPTARGELRRLFDTGLSDGQIATRTGKSIANIRTQRMVYNKERTQQGLPKIGSRKSKEPQPKD